MPKTIIVSNRLPVSIKKGKNGIEVYPSAGGLATGLSSYTNKRGSLWIGWPGITLDEIDDDERLEITKKLAQYNCQPVYLTQKQLDDFYNGYSNSLLWPFLHTMKADYSSQTSRWRAYREVNEIFAETILTLTEPGSTIWVHDYHFMLLPGLLRSSRPADKIGFFLHIPFPGAEHFASLKQAPALIRGLLGADLVGFHTREYVKGFLDSCQKLTGAALTKDGVALRDRVVKVDEFPMGIDYVKFNRAARMRKVKLETLRLRLKYRGLKTILTVDRLDPTKGFLQRLDAYRTLLKTKPELVGKVKMIMLAVPSREDVDAYRKLKNDVEKKVKNINKTFGTLSWRPIDYMYTSVPFEKLSALYRFADIAFVAPVKDGMNLVAKEYVASQGRRRGILILSEKAGAAHELEDALLVDPAKPSTLVTALYSAVSMPRKELKRRIKSMQATLSKNTVHNWANSFMKTLAASKPKQRTPALTPIRRTNLISNYQAAVKKLVIFDYDGVLAPFVTDPDLAKPTRELLNILKKIGRSTDTSLAIVSGRSREDLDKWFGKLPVTLAAEHGTVLRRAGSTTWKVLARSSRSWKTPVLSVLEEEAALAPGSFVEAKNYSVVWHYRAVAGVYLAQKAIARIKIRLEPLLKKYQLKLYRGDKILEIKDPGLHKGMAVKALLTKPYDFIMAVGDDFTDEDMFRALPKRAYTFKVGPGKTTARYRIRNVAEVQELLSSL